MLTTKTHIDSSLEEVQQREAEIVQRAVSGSMQSLHLADIESPSFVFYLKHYSSPLFISALSVIVTICLFTASSTHQVPTMDQAKTYPSETPKVPNNQTVSHDSANAVFDTPVTFSSVTQLSSDFSSEKTLYITDGILNEKMLFTAPQTLHRL